MSLAHASIVAVSARRIVGLCFLAVLENKLMDALNARIINAAVGIEIDPALRTTYQLNQETSKLSDDCIQTSKSVKVSLVLPRATTAKSVATPGASP